MKIVCECGREAEICNPPRFLEITQFVFAHSDAVHRPEKVKVVCVCGAEKMMGPGTLPDKRTDRDLLMAGYADAQWFKAHAGCRLPPEIPGSEAN